MVPPTGIYASGLRTTARISVLFDRSHAINKVRRLATGNTWSCTRPQPSLNVHKQSYVGLFYDNRR